MTPTERRTERALEKADRLWNDGLANITPLPEPDEYGQVKMSYKELRRLLEERRKLSWADGIFYGIASTMKQYEPK